VKQKLANVGHVFRGLGVFNALLVLEGKFDVSAEPWLHATLVPAVKVMRCVQRCLVTIVSELLSVRPGARNVIFWWWLQ